MAGVCSGPGPCDTTPLGTSTKPWVAKVGGLPAYIRAIAHSLVRSGHSESSAIATAVATVKRWAAGGGNVSAATRARAAAAVAEWESKKAASHSLTAEATMPLDLAVPVAASNDGPQMTVSVGQHMAALRKLAAAHKRAGPTQRPKIRAKMAEHAQAIASAKAKNLTADTAQPLDLAGAWDPSQHPRVAGKFAPKGTQTQGAKPKPGSPAPAALPPAMAAQIADFQRRNGLPVTGTFTPATVAAMQPKTGGGKGKAGGAKKGAKGGASKQHAAVKAYLKARQSAAKKAAAQAKKAQTPAGKATTAKAATMAAAAKSPAVPAYLKAGAAARAQQLASAKASTAPKAAVKASNAKATAAVAARLAHH